MMEKHSGRLIEQLQGVHVRQQKVIQQLQADNARLLCDLADIRRERDNFRAESGRSRRENADLQNRLDEAVSEYQDLKRERATLVRSVSTVSGYGRPPKPISKTQNSLSVLTGGIKSPRTEIQIHTANKNVSSPYPFRELPDPSGLKPQSPRPDNSVSTLTSTRNNAGTAPPRIFSSYALDLDA
ncbi:hypothetical protein PAXINDRAFT_99543 [Paxillus involutus ATCC 200175]|uniref:Uncharacterized protein n=1 Tax=Paxillus involutus ATCC 200175 TaxID=664439 RepID=A0A0C9U7C2_PAXIN|nr:hypothetical protein PAXINDRAFT_99543 [Paxillus involutus ATCC 200175]